MKVILSKEKEDIVRSFNGYDYTILAGKPVQVEDDFYEYLKENLGFLDFEPELKKDAVVAKIHRVPTKVSFPGGKFGTPTANLTRNVDGLPKGEFYGPGLEDDTP